MPLALKKAIRDGWKATSNNRFGDCLEARFIDLENNKILFRYAPKLEDKEFWMNFFKELEDFDEQNKLMREIAQKIDPAFLSQGNCSTG